MPTRRNQCRTESYRTFHLAHFVNFPNEPRSHADRRLSQARPCEVARCGSAGRPEWERPPGPFGRLALRQNDRQMGIPFGHSDVAQSIRLGGTDRRSRYENGRSLGPGPERDVEVSRNAAPSAIGQRYRITGPTIRIPTTLDSATLDCREPIRVIRLHP